MKKKLVLSAAVSTLLALTSCGNDDDEVAAKNLRSEIVANSSIASTTVVDEEQAGCVADGMVEDIGVDRLRDYDILTEDMKVNQGIENVEMSGADAEALADVFIECIDIEALFENQLAAGSTATTLTAEQQTCVSEAVSEGVVRKILTSTFRGERNGAYAALQDQIMECALSSE